MNDLVKNLMLWVVVAVVLMVVFQSFSPKTAGGSDEIIYSQFTTDVRGDRIKEVDIASDERSNKFTRTDGTTGFQTAPRRHARKLDYLLNNNHTIDPPPTDSGSHCWGRRTNFLPVLLHFYSW